ncbi:uncharacterized protein LOC114945023 [Nylanderia fulva]|uniref:uncharacterized protein LOC114945023 n=1 Tax=Nylanderia fulva TaxID=613905 RepID=UPI0010FAD4A2|nr:uncharacterized protein LOC114945023 [Nylanderia fulva]
MLTSAIYCCFLLYLVKTAYSISNTTDCETPFNETACCDVTDPNFGNGVSLLYYNCTNNQTSNYSITNPDGLINVLKNPIKPIKIVIHGYLQNGNDSKILSLAKAVCENGANHVIILD